MEFREVLAKYLADEVDANQFLAAIQALSDANPDYPAFKAAMDDAYDAMVEGGIGGVAFNTILTLVDWKSDASVNALKYIGEKAAPMIKTIPGDQALYNQYIEDKEKIFPYSEKPYPGSDGRAVIVSVKSEEAKEFWKGYFAYAKKVLKEAQDEYNQVINDKTHPLYGAYTIGKAIREKEISALMNQCDTHKMAEVIVKSDFTLIRSRLEVDCSDKKLEQLDKLYETTDVIITAKVGNMVKSLFGKLKEKR